MTDLYRLLEVSQKATDREIKSAYRKLARQFHPDVSASPDAHHRFAEISNAYQILSDPRRRRAYDRGEDFDSRRIYYAAKSAEIIAKEREFNLQVDEELESFRQQTAERRHAVLVVVPLFTSAFYVMIAKPTIVEGVNFNGRLVILALSLVGLVYLIKNLAVVLQRYTYQSPDPFTSVFKEEDHEDKLISRRAGLVFLVCGYIVSMGLGYVVSLFMRDLSPEFSLSTIPGFFIFPPIVVLIIGSVRRLGGLFDRF
ncbi:MAG: DnaJ domain-containing protein [Acidobacteria bacterium]|nr:DnaJ domain-containing protein [Acidobacteriota bacterium]